MISDEKIYIKTEGSIWGRCAWDQLWNQFRTYVGTNSGSILGSFWDQFWTYVGINFGFIIVSMILNFPIFRSGKNRKF